MCLYMKVHVNVKGMGKFALWFFEQNWASIRHFYPKKRAFLHCETQNLCISKSAIFEQKRVSKKNFFFIGETQNKNVF